MNMSNDSAITVRAAHAAESYDKIEALTAELLACRDLGTAKSLTLRIRLAADAARRETRKLAEIATICQRGWDDRIAATPMTLDPIVPYVDPPAPMDDTEYMMCEDHREAVEAEVWQ